MSRSSIVLITVIAAVLFFSQQAAGQFPIPKINIPKIPKKDTPATSKTPEPGTTTSSSSTPVSSNSKLRGRPIDGAKITFSNNPDGSNPKTTFNSSEFIYGRLDLGGKTMYDAFGFRNMGDVGFYYIIYHIKILKAGDEAWEHDWHNGRNFTLITKEDAKKTFWTFNVLPDPARMVPMRQSALEDDLNYYHHSEGGIYPHVRSVDSASSTFPQSGPYTVDITLFGRAFDDWGKPTGKTEQYPTAQAKLTFNFNGPDGRTLVANAQKAAENAESAGNKASMLHAMPDWWFKGGTYAEPKLAPGRLVPMIKDFISQWNLTYVKHMIVKSDGPLWVIEKNSLGIPEYRMVKPYIYIIYRDPKDSSCQVGALYMREPYAGGGTYGQPYLGGIREVQYIDCAAVK